MERYILLNHTPQLYKRYDLVKWQGVIPLSKGYDLVK